MGKRTSKAKIKTKSKVRDRGLEGQRARGGPTAGRKLEGVHGEADVEGQDQDEVEGALAQIHSFSAQHFW